MIRPTVVEFLDTMLRSKQGNLRIQHLVVTANSPMADKRISESGLKDRYSLFVIGYKKPAKEIEFNPNPSEILSPGTTLVVMGEISDLERIKKDI